MTLHNSHTNSFSENTINDYTHFGVYMVKDKAQFKLPNNTISLERVSNDKFLYKRKSHSNVIEKLISIRTKDLEMEIVPTLPLYLPAYKTDYMFLRFSKPIFVSRDSMTEIFVSPPIEIGLFFTGSEIREHFDVFACDPCKSRYALYGEPDHGKICKFAVVTPAAKEEKIASYFEGRLKVIVENELDIGISVGKITFPIRDHDLYYNLGDAAYDDLKVSLRERLGVKIADLLQQDGTGPAGWEVSPRTMEKTDLKFSMESGLD